MLLVIRKSIKEIKIRKQPSGCLESSKKKTKEKKAGKNKDIYTYMRAMEY